MTWSRKLAVQRSLGHVPPPGCLRHRETCALWGRLRVPRKFASSDSQLASAPLLASPIPAPACSQGCHCSSSRTVHRSGVRRLRVLRRSLRGAGATSCCCRCLQCRARRGAGPARHTEPARRRCPRQAEEHLDRKLGRAQRFVCRGGAAHSGGSCSLAGVLRLERPVIQDQRILCATGVVLCVRRQLAS